MNAKEFAHELEKAASFIRQQQAEIEALKAAKIRAYNNGVEDGRKPDTNNGPVAWMDYLEHSDVYDLNVSGRGIPLYTHPVEEQDESFDRTSSHMAGEYVSWTSCVACGQRVTGDSIHTCSPQLNQLTDAEIWSISAKHGDLSWHDHTLNFARAILRKAQEK